MKYEIKLESESLEKDLSNVTDMICGIVDKYLTQRSVSKNEVKMEELETKIDRLTSALGSLNSKLDTLSSSADYEKSKLKTLEEDFREVKTKVKSYPNNNK